MRVIVNVYDVQRQCNQRGWDRLGLGVYHTGVEIGGLEFSFGGNTMVRGTGVYATYPKQNANFSYKLSIDMGEIPIQEFLVAE